MVKNILIIFALFLGIAAPLKSRSESDGSLDILVFVDSDSFDSCQGIKRIPRVAIMKVIKGLINRQVNSEIKKLETQFQEDEGPYGSLVESKIIKSTDLIDKYGGIKGTKVDIRIDVYRFGVLFKTFYRTLSVSVALYQGDLDMGAEDGGDNDVIFDIERDKDGILKITARKICTPGDLASKGAFEKFSNKVLDGIKDGINKSNEAYQVLLKDGIEPHEARAILREESRAIPR